MWALKLSLVPRLEEWSTFRTVWDKSLVLLQLVCVTLLPAKTYAVAMGDVCVQAVFVKRDIQEVTAQLLVTLPVSNAVGLGLRPVLHVGQEQHLLMEPVCALQD